MKRSLAMICLTTLAALLVLCGAVVPRAAALSFATHADYATGAQPWSVAVGDFNGDGRQDLVTANRAANTVSVRLGNGRGGFGAKADFATGAGPMSVATGDFNGDGKQDLAVANQDESTVSVLLNTTSGGVLSFAAEADFATGAGPISVAVGDFDGDGKKDLAIANQGGVNTVSVLLNTTSGGILSFAAKADFATRLIPFSVVVADFDGDGKQDLATATNDGGPAAVYATVSVLLNTTMGGVLSFAPNVEFITGYSSMAVAVADFNRDGLRDVVTANWLEDSAVSILLNSTSADVLSFAPFTPYPLHTSLGVASSVATADMNGDGEQDVVVGAPRTYVCVLLGDGRGGLPRRAIFSPGGWVRSVAVGDFNRDGKRDVVTANEAANTVSVLLNTTTPSIASLSPTRGRVGTTVTIVGSPAGWSFGASRGTSKVYFGGKAATKYISWSKYKIKVRVPLIAKGKKAVTVRTSAGKSNTKYFTVI